MSDAAKEILTTLGSAIDELLSFAAVASVDCAIGGADQASLTSKGAKAEVPFSKSVPKPLGDFRLADMRTMMSNAYAPSGSIVLASTIFAGVEETTDDVGDTAGVGSVTGMVASYMFHGQKLQDVLASLGGILAPDPGQVPRHPKFIPMSSDVFAALRCPKIAKHVGVAIFIHQLECERSESEVSQSSLSPEVLKSRSSQGSVSRSRSPLPRLKVHKAGREEVSAMIDSKLEAMKEHLTQQFMSFTCEIKNDILRSVQDAISPRPPSSQLIKDQTAQQELASDPKLKASPTPDGASLLQLEDFKTNVDLSRAKVTGKKELAETFAAWGQRLKSCRGDLRTSLVILFSGVGSVDNLHATVAAMGVRITDQSSGATPYAHVAGDRAQPALQVVWKLLPEQKMTIQLNVKKKRSYGKSQACSC